MRKAVQWLWRELPVGVCLKCSAQLCRNFFLVKLACIPSRLHKTSCGNVTHGAFLMWSRSVSLSFSLFRRWNASRLSKAGLYCFGMKKRTIQKPTWFLFAKQARESLEKTFSKRPGHKYRACVKVTFEEAQKLGYPGSESDWHFLITEAKL